MSEKREAHEASRESSENKEMLLEAGELERVFGARKSNSFFYALFITFAFFAAFGFLAGIAGSRLYTSDAVDFCTKTVSQYCKWSSIKP